MAGAKASNAASLNQIHMQIMWNRLLAVAEEQAQILIRTAFSPTVREAGDLSAGVFDREGRMLAQAVTGTPGHVNAMAASVGAFLKRFPVDELEEGDALVTNDPWQGTGHLNDFTVVTPVFRDGGCVALFASTTHIADVGGLGFGPDGRQVFEEGLNIPMSFLFRKGQINSTLMEILKSNVRDPLVAEGDLYSLASCNHIGGERLIGMLEEFELATVEGVGALIIENSRQAMLDEIRKLPFGVYRNDMRIDGYDRPIDLVCAVTISESGIDIDFEGTSPTSGWGINVPLTYTQAYASFGVRCVIGGDIPNNAGSLDVIRVKAPEGCILNAPRPCAVSARHAVGQMLPDVVLGCLEMAGVAAPAEGSSCLFNPVFMGGVGIAGEGGDAGPSFVINPFYNGGTGARAAKDGLSATAFPSGVKNTPTEINETTAPLVIWRKEYRENSGGEGQYRGGLGQVLEFSHANGSAFVASTMFDRMQHPPRGRKNGKSGAPAKVYIKDGEALRGMGRQTIPANTRLVIETPGGGGIGDPADRDKEAIRRDRRDGLITV